MAVTGTARRLRPHALYLAWVTALAATLGSLYLSEILGLVPCVLCWFQRIFMYPLAVILGIAAYRGDEGVAPYSLALAGIGGGISLYHYLLQKVPALHGTGLCAGGVPCSEPYVNLLGFVTIPFLALVAFTVVAALSWSIMGSTRPAPEGRAGPGEKELRP
ncbi:MAG TPA: disulfide oxidoreductase [Bacillota bacterium]